MFAPIHQVGGNDMGKRKNSQALQEVMDDLLESSEEIKTSLTSSGTGLFHEISKEEENQSKVGSSEKIHPFFSSYEEKSDARFPEEKAPVGVVKKQEPKKPSSLRVLDSSAPKKSSKSEEKKSKHWLGAMFGKEEKEEKEEKKESPPITHTHTRTSLMGHHTGVPKLDASIIPVHITLKQSENLRVAQERILALETEIKRLREENEEIVSTGDIFRERLDKALVQRDHLKKIYEESREDFEEEKKILMETFNQQSVEIDKMKLKNQEMEKRLSNSIQHIQVRERELENRLELMKLEQNTLSREKDRYILDLKRQMNRLTMDLENEKRRGGENIHQLESIRTQSRQAVRALQMALNVLRSGHGFLEDEEEKKETI